MGTLSKEHRSWNRPMALVTAALFAVVFLLAALPHTSEAANWLRWFKRVPLGAQILSPESGYDATCTFVGVPKQVAPNERFSVAALFKNTGTSSWERNKVWAVLLSGSWRTKFANLLYRKYDPGYTGVAVLTLTAPSQPGTYPLEVQLAERPRKVFGQACTMVIPVVSAVPPPAQDRVTLSSVVIRGNDAAVAYGKNFSTCAHLIREDGQLVHTRNVFCDQGDNVTVVQPLTEVRVTAGQKVKLCHGNNRNVCSEEVTVAAEGSSSSASSSSDDSVTLSSVVIRGNDAAVAYGKNFSTCAHLIREDGQLVHTRNVFCDQGDNVTVVQPLTEVRVTAGQKVKLCHGNNRNVCSEEVTVAVEGSSSSVSSSVFSSSSSSVHYDDPCDLASVRCSSSSSGPRTGNLYITASTTTTRPHQLLGGTVGGSILNLTFRATGEPVAVTFLAFTATGNPSSIDRLELYKAGLATPFAHASRTLCGEGYGPNVWCAAMQDQLVVP
ncbi:MAG: hypothetical protein AAB728_02300, partial [Patescibacteria group bacterium]